MSVSIWSEQYTGVVEPTQLISFDFLLSQPDGQPAASTPVDVDVTPVDTASVPRGPLVTDNAGKVTVTLQAGNRPAKATFVVTSGDNTRSCTLYITDVYVNLPSADKRLGNVSLEEEQLLQMLYWDKDEVRVLRQFGGGLSGSRVLQVQAEGNDCAELSQVVKIGVSDSILDERDNYERRFKGRLAQAAPVVDAVTYGTKAAIIYGDASAANVLDDVMPLSKYFLNHTAEELHTALFAVLESGLRNVYRFHTVRREDYRQLLGKYLPENLVVSLGQEDKLDVFPSGSKIPGDVDFDELTPRHIARRRFKVTPGDIVLLRGFRVSKMQEDDMNLEDAQRRKYKVKVRYDGVVPDRISTGDNVDVLARFVTDRTNRMGFAVRHCLERHGAQSHPRGWTILDEIYPDPIRLLQRLLDLRCDVACGAIHGDLHWENVVLEAPENWWLIDYGLTCEGPILFDFVKLEIYLRDAVLSTIRDFTDGDIVAFENSLVENPLGELPEAPRDHPQLHKAAVAIQAIRRMARRYVVDDMFEYWRLLFGLSVALTKYYPTEDKWTATEQEGKDKARLETSDRQTFHCLALALALGRLIAWDLGRTKGPKFNVGFVPFGTKLESQPRTVALDVGGCCEPGVVDHHSSDGERGCSTTAVLRRPDLITSHLGDLPASDATWIMHEWPDFDCIASTFLAWHRQAYGFFPPGARRLADYAAHVDAGAQFLDEVAEPERTPYALFMLHLSEADAHRTLRDQHRMQRGWKVLDYLCGLEATGTHVLSTNCVPHDHPFWDAVAGDREKAERYDLCMAKRFRASVLVNGLPEETDGMVLEAPRSVLFKTWARRSDGTLLVVRWPNPDKPDHRIVVSVPPRIEGALKGLGKRLEMEESAQREQLGKLRPRPPEQVPRWPDVDNADPWYDGRSPIHDYTIVDSPREGTVLSIDDVLGILVQGDWLPETADA